MSCFKQSNTVVSREQTRISISILQVCNLQFRKCATLALLELRFFYVFFDRYRWTGISGTLMYIQICLCNSSFNITIFPSQFNLTWCTATLETKNVKTDGTLMSVMKQMHFSQIDNESIMITTTHCPRINQCEVFLRRKKLYK